MPNGTEICTCGKTPVLEKTANGKWRGYCIHCKLFGPWCDGPSEAASEWREMHQDIDAEDLI